MTVVNEWHKSIAEADRYARTHAKQRGTPSHAVRCNHMRNGERCTKPDGHDGEHTERKLDE